VQRLLDELRELLVDVLVDERTHHFQARPVRDIGGAVLDLVMDMSGDVTRQQHEAGSRIGLERASCARV
jgi:hypothetical protein